MKKLTLALLFATCCLHSSAQLYWKWAANSSINLHGAGNIGSTTAIDNAGNVYVAGAVADTCTIGNISLTPRAVGDMLILKYNKAGQLLWAKMPAGTYDGALVQAIVTGTNGHVYIAGWANPPSYFDTVVAGTEHGHDRTFVARMDTDGNFLWVKTAWGLNGWSQQIKNRQLAVDADNNVYLSNGAGGGGGTYRCFDTLLTAPYGGVNIIKFNPDGAVQWRHSVYGNNPSGNALSSPVMYVNNNKEMLYAGALSRVDTLHGNYSYFNLVIGKLDSNGNRIWHKEYGDTLLNNWIFNSVGADMTVDDEGNMYLFGTYSRAFQIGMGPYASPSARAFVTKFDNTGNAVWSQFTNRGVGGSGIAYNKQKQQVLITSCYNGTLTLGGYTITMPAMGINVKMFVAAYDTAGNVVWLASYGRDSSATVPYRTTINNTQKMYAVTGYFSDSTSFGNHSLYASGGTYHRDFFVAVASLDSNKSTTGIPEVTEGLNFTIYPNPSADIVHIEAEALRGPVDLYVLNMQGSQVYSSILTNKAVVNTSQLANGRYMIVLKRGDAFFAKPLLVVH